MNADDLDYRARTLSGCIPPALVSRLISLGHVEEVKWQAGRGEWFCARAWAQLLAGQERRAEARELLAPYVATGWWKAAETMADLLESWGQVEEAITLTRPYADAENRLALDYFARLLGRNGRGDDAFALLEPHVHDWFLATALVAVAAGAGRDDDAAELLTARVKVIERRCDDLSCSCGAPDPFAVGLLAEIRERQGRIDEAIALLHTRSTTSINNRDQLADLLARHDRIQELRAYAASEHHGHAAQRLAELLEERGDVDGAIGVYQHLPNRGGNEAVQLAELLARHGRGDEALEMLRSTADAGGADDWLVHTLCEHYAAQGRAEDGLAYLDTLRERLGEEYWEFFSMRLPLMVACGRLEEAIELAKAHPEGETLYAVESIAELLADAGRAEEAITILEQQGGARSALASHLIERGRVRDAVTLLQRHEPRPPEQSWTGAATDSPPF
ncbi:tetratricopeptide repeat protein [Plantactinospora endophytica]|uniref:Tetratricopeptide repeat protein n=1 Tax=Plantactinospora endophytica TaxID=673535 RepID=A0ABQ4DZB7_9ACTN|nr:hypothetical protein [Plantactinospora endophytica]GIG87803.1 hypothetical protein Pen02_27390 [Plantactinospora endophytica]